MAEYDDKGMDGAATGAAAGRSVAVFAVGGCRCALPAEAVEEVLLLPELACPPGMPSVFEGVMNLEGLAVPVLRLDRLFGLPEGTPGLYSPLILLRGLVPRTALLVDEVREVRRLEGARAVASVVPGAVLADCTVALIGEGEHAIHLLDPQRLLLEGEQARLTAFQAREQERLAGWGASSS
ncbi:MAG: chemotaxis protein CheW [Magnetospirillum sp. WYHS-4]